MSLQSQLPLPIPGAISSTPYRRSAVEGFEEKSLPAIILLNALRRRWWAFALITAIAAAIGYLIAIQFGKTKAVVETTLINVGLPQVVGNDAYRPLAPGACAELMTSVNVLGELQEAQGLRMPHAALRQLIQAKVDGNSSFMKVSIVWSDLDDGIAIANQLSEIFIEEIARRRRETLQNYVQHLETSQLQVRTAVDEARREMQEIQLRHQALLDEAALNNERYKSLLASVLNTELAIDERRVEQLGIEQQVAALQREAEQFGTAAKDLQGGAKRDVLNGILDVIRRRLADYPEGSPAFVRLKAIGLEVREMGEAADVPIDFEPWQQRLSAIVSDDSGRLSPADLQEINQVQVKLLAAAQAGIASKATELARRDSQRQERLLSLIPVKQQIAMLEGRLEEYRKQADEMGAKLTGIDRTSIDASIARLEQAEDRQRLLTDQLDAMRELEKCRLREWSTSAPAIAETASVSSNRTKMFALGFGLCGLALSAPVLLGEWNRCRPSPGAKFAKAMNLPLLDDTLQSRLPGGEQYRADGKLSPAEIESLRTVTLRIQQSTGSGGCTILFSSIDSFGTAVPLTAGVAECLAERQERVLVIDAISPEKAAMPLANLLTPIISESAVQTVPLAGDSQLSTSRRLGLADFFASEDIRLEDLANQTDLPGIDLITSGSGTFPREAMASRRLTALVDAARSKYSLILVNGPPVVQAADMQMLAARADGIVLTASKSINRDAKNYLAACELLDLGAPIIGIVA